jgi:hypothetical protein
MGTTTIRRRFYVGGVLTDATTAKLSDSTGSYGIIRTDTSAAVVADGTDMTHESTGTYSYTLTTISGVAYKAYLEFVHGGNTYRAEVDINARTDATDADTAPYTTLRQEIADLAGWGRTVANWNAKKTEKIAAVLKAAVRQAHYPYPAPANRPGHTWSFLRPVETLWTTAPYKTGTLTIASGAVTLASGTFPSWAADGELVIAGGTYTVGTRDGDTQLTLDDTSVDADAGTTYSLDRPTVDLPSDFGGMNGPLTYPPGASSVWPPIRLTKESEIRRMRQANRLTSRPTWAAHRPKKSTGIADQVSELFFWPTPDAAYAISCPYTVTPPELAEATPYLLGGPAFYELCLAACLAVAEQRILDRRDYLTEQYDKQLRAAIDEDKRRSTPDFLGYNADNSDAPAESSRYADPTLIFTHEGMSG